jgi:hypothetical protein
MKALQRIPSPSNTTSRELGLIATIMGIIAPATAFAASGAGEESSGIFVWIFLGFCALIIAAQIVPAVLLMFGMVKGVASVVKEKMATDKK